MFGNYLHFRILTSLFKVLINKMILVICCLFLNWLLILYPSRGGASVCFKHQGMRYNVACVIDQQRAQEQVLELLPMISEVNAVSEELNKYRHFELVLISAGYQEEKDKGTK